jgi:hypothetical protein
MSLPCKHLKTGAADFYLVVTDENPIALLGSQVAHLEFCQALHEFVDFVGARLKSVADC